MTCSFWVLPVYTYMYTRKAYWLIVTFMYLHRKSFRMNYISYDHSVKPWLAFYHLGVHKPVHMYLYTFTQIIFNNFFNYVLHKFRPKGKSIRQKIAINHLFQTELHLMMVYTQSLLMQQEFPQRCSPKWRPKGKSLGQKKIAINHLFQTELDKEHQTEEDSNQPPVSNRARLDDGAHSMPTDASTSAVVGLRKELSAELCPRFRTSWFCLLAWSLIEWLDNSIRWSVRLTRRPYKGRGWC